MRNSLFVREYQKTKDRRIHKAEILLKSKKKVAKVLDKAGNLCLKLRNTPKIGKYCHKASKMCNLIRDCVLGEYKELPMATILTMLAAIMYWVSPIDFIPDFIPVLGWLDDAAIIGVVIEAIDNDIREYESWKQEVIDV